VVEKIHSFFLAGETESVFEITNWSTQNVIHHGFGNASWGLWTEWHGASDISHDLQEIICSGIFSQMVFLHDKGIRKV
jgi:hypothetical protein